MPPLKNDDFLPVSVQPPDLSGLRRNSVGYRFGFACFQNAHLIAPLRRRTGQATLAACAVRFVQSGGQVLWVLLKPPMSAFEFDAEVYLRLKKPDAGLLAEMAGRLNRPPAASALAGGEGRGGKAAGVATGNRV